MSQGAGRGSTRSDGTTPRDDAHDRFLGAVVIEAAYRRGASRQELIDLAIAYKRLDVAKLILDQPKVAEGA